MEMRDNIPGLIQRLMKNSSPHSDDKIAIGEAAVYLTYLYDILKKSEENLQTGERNDK